MPVRKRILSIFLLLALFLTACSLEADALISLLEEYVDSQTDPGDLAQIESDASDGSDFSLPETEAFTVVRVVDGDTIWVQDQQGERWKVRIIGVDAPETEKEDHAGEPFAQEAFDFALQTLSERTVYLERDVSEVDQYGRLLRYVWLKKPDHSDEDFFEKYNFSALLVRGGYAKVVAYGPDTRYEPRLRALEKSARTDRLGIWSFGESSV